MEFGAEQVVLPGILHKRLNMESAVTVNVHDVS